MSQHDKKPIRSSYCSPLLSRAPGVVNPFEVDPAAGVLLLSGVGALGRHLMGSDEERVGISQNELGGRPYGAAV
jgi:hypothetical protein